MDKIKVIIADDEKRIVNLIQFLVDWEALGMQVVGVAHDGIDALEKIRENQPDVVITDIKMPGCDGLKLIEESKKIRPDINYVVISGYKQFAYAKQAIQHGVSNYILKPIDQEELMQTLTKVKDQLQIREKEKSSGELLEELEKTNSSRQRKQFISDMVYKEERLEGSLTLAGINEHYSYHFAPGVFQTAVVKVDGIHEQTNENRRYLEEKISTELRRNLTDCFEWEYSELDGIYYLVLNYKPEQMDIKTAMKLVLDGLLVQQYVLEHFQLTIGIGMEEQSAEVFRTGFKAAKWAIDQRLVRGTNRVIQGQYKSANAFVDTDIFKDFNREFSEAIELQDLLTIIGSIDRLEERLLERSETTGYEIYQMVKEAVNMYLFTLRKFDMPAGNTARYFENFSEEINNCGLAHETFSYLRERIKTSFEALIREKNHMDSRPIRIARTYISDHLSEPISLEIVSDAVGFNTAYFSTVFKKETGSTFTEYLQKRRMEKAKELLRLTKEPVSSICAMVGYNDVKHFTKNFVKYTRLKPKEYRSLYS